MAPLLFLTIYYKGIYNKKMSKTIKENAFQTISNWASKYSKKSTTQPTQPETTQQNVAPTTTPAQQPATKQEPTEVAVGWSPEKGTVISYKKDAKSISVNYRFGGKKPLKWLTPQGSPLTDTNLIKKLNLEAYKLHIKKQSATPQQPTQSNSSSLSEGFKNRWKVLANIK